MIERYSRPEIADIFSDETKYTIWKDIEVLAVEARAHLESQKTKKQRTNKLSKASKKTKAAKNAQASLSATARAAQRDAVPTLKDAAFIKEHASFSVPAIDKVEAQTRHDVIAFLTVMNKSIDRAWKQEQTTKRDKKERQSSKAGSKKQQSTKASSKKYTLPPSPSRFVHYGMTSSDVLDTAFSVQLKAATDILLKDIKQLAKICIRRAHAEQHTLAVGRSHGIHAEPMSFGLKFASWAQELHRDYERLQEAKKQIAVGQISGAIGTYSSVDPKVEAYVCKHLGLTFDPCSTQVISRDRHAFLASVLAITAATAERIAVEIRHLQKTEVLEAQEPFAKGQKGSSAMPHKKNPITAEKVAGLSRIVKANCQVAYDNVALWHERDISHSSAERVIFADSCIALDHMLQSLIRIVGGLVLYPRHMQKNLDATRGLIYSSKVLLALTDAGLSREEAYAVVQDAAMKTWDAIVAVKPEDAKGAHFVTNLLADKRNPLTEEEIRSVMDAQQFLHNAPKIFKRLDSLKF